MAAKNRITLEAIDGGVRFTFINCDHYLQNGTIDVPLNSLSLIFDESDMATFRKAASNDIFISAPITYFYGLDTKEDLADFYTENMVGGSGGGGSLEYYSEEEGQALIEVPSNIDGANGVDVFNNGVNIYANEEQVGETSLYVSPTAVTINDDVVVTESMLEDYATVGELSDKADVSAVTAVADSLSGKQDTLVSGTNIKTINNTSLLGSGNIDIQGGGGSSISSCTQAQYDAAEQGGTLDSDTMYVISDAPAVNIANYYTKTEVDDLLLNIDIDVDSAITSSGTNAVQGSAIYTALQGKVNNGDAVTNVGVSTFNSSVEGMILYKGGTPSYPMYFRRINGNQMVTSSQASATDLSLVTQSDYDEAQRVTATALNDLNDRFGGMRIEKLTQAQYDALVTKDDNTLYIITNVVNNNA